MSEQNILNPTVGDSMNPDYGYSEGLGVVVSSWQARSGRTYARQIVARGRTFDLDWNMRQLSDKQKLQAWAQQYEQDYFSYADWENARYFTGRFAGPPTFTPAGNNNWNIKAQFVEMPGVPMFSYPANWGVDSLIYAPTNSFADMLWKRTGTWTYAAAGNLKNTTGFATWSAVIGDMAEFQYFGYGCRIWGPKNTDRGKFDWYLDGVLQASAVDQYNASFVGPIMLTSATNVSLGLHRVKMVVATKNPSSSANTMVVDALEVMR